MAKRFPIIRTLQDKILIIKTRAGDEHAFLEIYNLYFKDIYTFIYFKVPSKEVAEDLAAEVFFKAWEYIYAKKEVHDLRAFLFVVARNRIVDYYRERKDILTEDKIDDEIEHQIHFKENIALSFDKEKLYGVLKSLTEEQQEIIILHYIQGFSYQEIGEVIGKKSGAVRVIAHRALEKLKELILL